MSEINSFSDYASKYNTNMDYSSLFGGGAPYIDNALQARAAIAQRHLIQKEKHQRIRA